MADKPVRLDMSTLPDKVQDKNADWIKPRNLRKRKLKPVKKGLK